MSYSHLNADYYFNKSGEKDNFIEVCTNCIVQNIYFILKNMPNVEFDPFNLFLEDATPLLIIKQLQRQLVIVNYLPLKTKFMDQITYNITVHKSDPNVVPYLERLIDQGKPVMVQTISEMLSYSILYNTDYVYELDEKFDDNGHAILFLWYDEEYFYFHEHPVMVNTSRCQYFNKEILKITKTEIAAAFYKYTKITTIDVDKNIFKNNQPNDFILKGLVNNYFLQNNSNDIGELRFHGLDAIKKLIDICDHAEEFSNFKFEYGFLEADVFRLVISRKEILHEWLLKYSNSKLLCDSSREVVDSWNIAKRTYIKNILRKNKPPRIEASSKKSLENILRKEEIFINNLKDYLNSNYTIKGA